MEEPHAFDPFKHTRIYERRDDLIEPGLAQSPRLGQQSNLAGCRSTARSRGLAENLGE
jgi:hypothetical protein